MPYRFDLKGYVYFAQHLDRDVLKIGFSACPVLRVQSLCFAGETRKFRLLGAIRGTGLMERDAHLQFRRARLMVPDGNEFFQYSMIKDEVAGLLAERGAQKLDWRSTRILNRSPKLYQLNELPWRLAAFDKLTKKRRAAA